MACFSVASSVSFRDYSFYSTLIAAISFFISSARTIISGLLLKHDYLNMYLTISLRNIDKIIYESLPDRHIYVSILWCEPHCLYWISILKIVKFTVPVIIFFLHFILTICSNIMHIQKQNVLQLLPYSI